MNEFRVYVRGLRFCFEVVSADCPTVREGRFRTVTPHMLLWALLRDRVERILVTATDPVRLVIVRRTYPTLSYEHVRISKTDFNHFRMVVCVPKKVISPDWKSYGF